ncbi:MAG TPA: Smr/MutS family protein [Stellaceae bacterium]|jgi:DNA-nicking Smr family endonuclease|nr:Smr/MutS family protein [Stellaceae bacterium]
MRTVRSDERTLWRETMRGVTPYRPEPPAEELAVPPPSPPRETKSRRMPTSTQPAPPARAAKTIDALDRRTATRLKRGTLAIEARLDLHGMTQSEAHDALTRFIARAQKHGSRAVLVITGKSGVLHGTVPRWLDEGDNRGRILAIRRAHAQHGGEGALYLMLRRTR